VFRRIVLLTWKPDATPEQRAAVAHELRQLPAVIAEIRHFDVEENLAAGPGSADLGVVADFDSAEDWQAYVNHPAHQKVVTDYISPIVASRTSLQYNR